jgi:hypothetical protein
MEIQLEAGDLVDTREAVFEAMQSAAAQILGLASDSDTLDVPRGQAAYLIEAGWKRPREEQDDGA